MLIREAQPDDAEKLTTLRWRSKGYWGYSAEWVRLAEGPVLVPVVSHGQGHLMFVLEDDGQLLGFYSLIRHDPDLVELDDFFLEPTAIGKGWGRVLWQDAVKRCRELLHTEMKIIADPHAESFYLKQGAVREGAIVSRSDPTRILPTLTFDL